MFRYLELLGSVIQIILDLQFRAIIGTNHQPRENLPPRYLPRRERQYSIVDGLYGRLLCGGSHTLIYLAPWPSTRGHIATLGG